MSVENLPWFADVVNFLVTGQTPPHWSAQDIRKFNHEISELDELRRDAYDNSKLSKERMKVLHDKHIQRKNFEPNEQVLLYNSRLHLFPGKLRSRWSGPYVVKTVFPYGAVEITNPQNGNTFKVNGQRLKNFLPKLSHEDTSIPLEDPIYSPGS
ncbi:hypothetical protein F2P56_035614 [Juglans regia]|uniref:Uncharacterized protein n=1 Tax=Juglans regia TaxID=51240 RepID=A0A833WSG4_JUGRE|nr:hypothetical protein F2P56_035614 [Juglans regia]